MISIFSEAGGLLAGNLSVLPEYENALSSVIAYLGSAWPMWVLFFIGIGLGFWFRGRRRTRARDPKSVETVENFSVPATTMVADSERRERKLIAELEGELSAVRNLEIQQREELGVLQKRLESVRRQRDEKQERFETLSDLLDNESTPATNRHSLAQVRAPLVHLDELVLLERQHLESGLERLQDLEDRLSGDSQNLWDHAESVATIRARIESDSATGEGPEADFISRVGEIDEHLRIFHQNAQGCLRRIATSKLRLQADEKRLEEAAGPIAEAEVALAELAAAAEPPEGATIEAAFEKARSLLSQSRPAVDALENGIEQEIAELTGRIDWVVKDSPRNFLNALDELDSQDPPSGPESNESFNEIWRHLSEAKRTLTGIELPLDGNSFGESAPEPGKHRIGDALDQSLLMMESASLAHVSVEPETQPPEAAVVADGRIAHLERQLDLRESETARLDQKLKLNTRELRQLREENEQLNEELDSAGLSSETSGSGGNFVRRLLGLGPGSESPYSVGVPDFSGPESSGGSSAVTLAEARQILGELRLASTNGSGNGGHGKTSEPVEEAKSAPASSEDPLPEPVEDDFELDYLRQRITRQKIRIEELEQSISQLRKSRAAALSANSRSQEESQRQSGPDILSGDRVKTEATEVVLFRGNDPGAWETDFDGPGGHFAVRLENLPDEIHYLRMSRLDTGDSVVIPISRGELLGGASGGEKSAGWTGKGERYFESDHLGIYDESLPREVETKFGAGGWGFGHGETIGAGQAHGWAGRRIEPTDFQISAGTEPLPNPPAATATPETPSESPADVAIPDSGLIVFRSNKPEAWGKNTYSGANCRSRQLDDLPEDISWLRLRCLPGGESVILPITRAELTENGDGFIRGFNGSNESFYGARHLGAFDEALPQEVETRFTYGGWGFGHCPSGPEEQSCGWAGHQIDSETVFEISVYREMPFVDEFLDRVLEG